ncbi:L,D-transpeptidase family protein [Halochromatium salexigens]|nr:L,D-transpeptidase family protein [Halochromatium salexigens]
MHIRTTHRTRIGHSLWAPLFALGLVLLLGGCAQLPSQSAAKTSAQLPDDVDLNEIEEIEVAQEAIPEPQEDPEPGPLYEWDGRGRRISHVVIDTNAQRARFYDGLEQVGWTTIASGVSSHPTPSGEFEVIEKVAKKRSNLYGRIYNASGGLHKSNAHSRDPIPEGGKFVGARMPHFMRMTYDGIGMHAGAIPQPGQPASHGCIRLPDEVASSLFAHADIGTRVTVIGNGPDYGDYAERIRQQRAQERRNRVAKAERQSEASTEAPAERNEDSGSESQTEAQAETPPRTDNTAAEAEETDSTTADQPETSVGRSEPVNAPSSQDRQEQGRSAPPRTDTTEALSGTSADTVDAAETATAEAQGSEPRQAVEDRAPTAPRRLPAPESPPIQSVDLGASNNDDG